MVLHTSPSSRATTSGRKQIAAKKRSPKKLARGPKKSVSLRTRRSSVGVREMNQYLSKVLDRVKKGEIVEITERGLPIATMVPIDITRKSLFEEMVASGLVRPAKSADQAFDIPLQLWKGALSPAEELLRENEAERARALH